MEIGDRVKVIKSVGLNVSTKDEIGFTGTVREIQKLPHDIQCDNIRLSKAGINKDILNVIVDLDYKYTKNLHYTSATFVIDELMLIDEPEDISFSDTNETAIPKNTYIKKGGETFVTTDYINNDVTYKGDLYSIVNDYILPLGIDNGWSKDEIDKVLNLRTEDDVRKFLYEYMDEYLD